MPSLFAYGIRDFFPCFTSDLLDISVSKEWSCCDTTVSDPGDMEYEHTTSG